MLDFEPTRRASDSELLDSGRMVCGHIIVTFLREMISELGSILGDES